MKRKVRDDEGEMDVDAAPTPGIKPEITQPMKKKRKPSYDVETLLSDAISSIPELSPKETTDLLRRSSSNPYNTGKAIVKRCRHVASFQQCFSEDEKKSFTAIKDFTLPDMKELKALTDMQRVALRYHIEALSKLETDYHFKNKKTEDGSKEKSKENKKKEETSLQFIGEHISCPAIPKNTRRKIEMIVKRIDKRNKDLSGEDLKKKSQQELKQVLGEAAELKKGELTNSLKDSKIWERQSVKFTLSGKLREHLSGEQKFNKKELTYVRLHIFKTSQIIGQVNGKKSKISTKKSDKKKTKVLPAKKVKETNKKTKKG